MLNIVLLVVTAVAVAVAWRSTQAASQTVKEASRIQGQLSTLEKKRNLRPTKAQKAVFNILVRRSAAGSPYTFVLQNKGGGAARDFGVLWNNDLFSRAPQGSAAQQTLPEVVAPGRRSNWPCFPVLKMPNCGSCGVTKVMSSKRRALATGVHRQRRLLETREAARRSLKTQQLV